MKPQHAWLDALENERRVPDYALQVAAVFARYGDNPDDTWVTFRRLSHHTHQHNDKLSKSLGWLRDNGWLKVTDEGRGKRTHYQMTRPVRIESAPDGRSTPNGRITGAPDGRTTSAPDGLSTNAPEVEGKRSARGARAGGGRTPEQIIQMRLGCTEAEGTAVLAAIRDARPNIMSPTAVLPRFGEGELRGYLDDVRVKQAARAEAESRKASATCKTCDDRGVVATSPGCVERCYCRTEPAVEHEGAHPHG